MIIRLLHSPEYENEKWEISTTKELSRGERDETVSIALTKTEGR